MPDFGKLSVQVVSAIGAAPVEDATIAISYSGNPDNTLEQITTNDSGFADTIELPSPPLEYSVTPSEPQPYSNYTLTITAPGYQELIINSSEILPDVIALQKAPLVPMEAPPVNDVIVIPAHTLYGEYPPKIPEEEIKPTDESGEIVLSRVVIPEFMVVHDGSPTDSTAQNYYVRYKDYIKNVVSSEIYATWTESTIYANTLAILSFSLNRVYTEWYRNQGYDFTITSSTAFDQKWINGRNIYDTVDRIVDTIFTNYLSRPNVRQPIFTQYCDGRRVTCPNGLSQWGSQSLGEQGYTPIQIIHNYYGSDMYINTSEEISGIPASWPGYNLTIGSSGDKVRMLQEQLNRIAQDYPSLSTVTPDGIYGQNTANTVRQFQRIFGLPATGITDYSTWYKISEIYVGVSRIAEP
ncbi:MAG: peptidoglycan-binding protein [bacterium]|nr:peptidoglycan-binding protein [bacterium]